MGAADVIPGVSGGTIAFITGIYDTLLNSISAFNFSLFKLLKEKGVHAVWKKINGNFLLSLLAGIATAVLSLAKLLHYLMIHHPIPLWSFFFGLITASILYIGRMLDVKTPKTLLGLVMGTLFVFYLSILPPFGNPNSWWYLILSGMIASCAMILPGISGSFILLLLGVYSVIINAISNLSDFNVEAAKVLILIAFGGLTGLISFSRLLKYMLRKHNSITLAVLTGFLIGSLWKIWPWKSTSEVFLKNEGVIPFCALATHFQSLSAFLQQNHITDIKPYKETNILPQTYALINHTQSHLLPAILFALLGFILIFAIEFIAKKKF